MIGKLTGIVDSIFDGGLIIDVSGVGYLVSISDALAQSLSIQESASIYIETVWKQETLVLYGFGSLDEKICFQKLTSVQGVGGKSALSILSALSIEDIVSAISYQDPAPFKRADGVGPKVATRIINELKDFPSKFKPVCAGNTPSSSSQKDAIALLVQLGYKNLESSKIVQDICKTHPEWETETIIPEALKRLSSH
jgi:Holliday junction DNA helicase RuvA